MNSRDVIFLTVRNGDGSVGRGEIAPLNGLSEESIPEIKSLLDDKEKINNHLNSQDFSDLPSSLIFGMEMALRDLKNQKNGIVFESGLPNLKKGIPINGLVWMGDESFIKDQIDKKINAGFSSIKIKIGRN